MKYKGKLNLSPVTYTTGMESLYGNCAKVNRSGSHNDAQGEQCPNGICCVQHSPIAVCGAALFLSCNFVEEIKNFFLPTRSLQNFQMP